MVMIGIDPHKRTHTGVAIDDGAQVFGERLVRATSQAGAGAAGVGQASRWR
jgi:hypothetical protein